MVAVVQCCWCYGAFFFPELRKLNICSLHKLVGIYVNLLIAHSDLIKAKKKTRKTHE